MTNIFAKGYDLEGKSYTGILMSSILCDFLTQVASFWFSVPHNHNFPGLGSMPSPAPSGYATGMSLYSDSAFTHLCVRACVRACVRV